MREVEKLKRDIENLQEVIRKMSEEQHTVGMGRSCQLFSPRKQVKHILARSKAPGENCGECLKWQQDVERCKDEDKLIRGDLDE